MNKYIRRERRKSDSKQEIKKTRVRKVGLKIVRKKERKEERKEEKGREKRANK